MVSPYTCIDYSYRDSGMYDSTLENACAMKVDVVGSASTRHTQHHHRFLIHLRRAPPPRAPPPRAPPPRAPPPSSCRRRLERDSASRAPPPRAPPPRVPPPRAPPPCAPPLLRESARINRDKEGLRKQRPHATVASPPSVRPRDVRRLLELLLHLAAIGGALQRQSIAKGLERADERQCPG